MRLGRRRLPRALGAGVVTLLLAGAGARCSRNAGPVPIGFVPEGTGGAVNLLTTEFVPGPAGTGMVRVTIYDRTPADGYRVYRRLGSQGFDPAVNYVATFSGSTDRGFEVYEVIDRDWRADRSVEYLGRGTLAGHESRLSPLTNVGAIPLGDSAAVTAPDTLHLKCPVRVIDSEGNAVPMKTDTLLTFVWKAVSGAVRYRIVANRIDGRLAFEVLTPADGSTSYRVDSGAGIVLQRARLTPDIYSWEAEAIDAQSRVIARAREVEFFEVDPPKAGPPCVP